jgi:hypothetical protein
VKLWFRFIRDLTALTAIAIAAAIHAATSIQLSSIYSTDVSNAELIRMRCPIHLVRPEWIENVDLLEWWVAETKARFGAMALIWILGVAILSRHFVRARRERIIQLDR